MNSYEVTCLTPLLVGDGQRLAPIDYMVWRDQVNVLDQKRIFRLLSKGPRLESYLNQIRRVDKLDFASWGGYAQNFASRRIPFDDPGAAVFYEKAHPADLFIPTFATSHAGPYLPATAIKGPLRTAMLIGRMNEQHLRELGTRMSGDRPPRHPAEPFETATLGPAGVSRTRPLRVADSNPVPAGSTRIYLLRTATLVARGPRLELGWKISPRGAVDGRRPADGNFVFAEMAAPGTVFQGHWSHHPLMSRPEVLRALRWKDSAGAVEFAAAANLAAETLLEAQRQFAETAGLEEILSSLGTLRAQLEEARRQTASCLLCIGWGSGFLAKTTLLKEGSDALRQVLRQHPFYGKAVQTALPFPKTRRIIFQAGRPACLPGWARVDFQLHQ